MSWQKQTLTKPLFPDILWNRPINKRTAGNILIIGGHGNQFSHTQNVYTAALSAGAGSVTVALPKSVQKLIGNLPDCEFLPANPSGSLAKEGLEELLELSNGVDATVLAGELSNNTETVGMLSRFMQDHKQTLVVCEEVINTFHKTPDVLPIEGMYVMSVATAASLAQSLKIPIDIKTANPQKTARLLQELSLQLPDVMFALYDGEHIFVQAQDHMSATPQNGADSSRIAGYMSTFMLQHSNKFEALTTGAYVASGGETDI